MKECWINVYRWGPPCTHQSMGIPHLSRDRADVALCQPSDFGFRFRLHVRMKEPS